MSSNNLFFVDKTSAPLYNTIKYLQGGRQGYFMSAGRRPQNIGHHNNKLVARLLLDDMLSGKEISQKTGLTNSSASVIIDRLMNMQLIKMSDVVPEKRKRGRQHIRYTINASRAYCVCISFQNSYESFVICDILGTLVYKEILPIHVIDKEYFNGIIERIKSKLDQFGIGVDRIAVASVAVSGQVDQFSGKMITSFMIRDDFIIKDRLASEFPYSKIEVKNDTVYCCLKSIISDEFDYSNGSSVFLYVDDGISNVIVYNKQVITGPNGFAGEIGTNCIGENGMPLHDVLSRKILLEYGRKLLGEDDVTIERIGAAAETNAAIKDEFIMIARKLGYILRNLIDIAGCSHIVFSGSITKYPKFFFDTLLTAVKNCGYCEGIPYKIDLSQNGEAIYGQIALSRLAALDWVMEQY